ncbi:MAG: hypothetical protein ACE5FG_05640 [Myxococcota bacterium]
MPEKHRARPTWLPTLAALALLALPSSSVHAHLGGVLQKPAQQKCINTLNKSLASVAKARGKGLCKCLKDGSKGKLVGSIESCVSAAPDSKLSKARQKTLAKESQSCPTSPTDPSYPDFAYTSGVSVNAAGEESPLLLIHELFGSDLDAAIRPDDRSVAKCQVDIAKRAKKCFETRLKAFVACKKDRLRGPPVDTGEDLQQVCLQQDPNAPATGQPDPKGKIAKACAARIAGRLGKKCAGVDLMAAFPGWEGSPAFENFVDERAACAVCQAVNRADSLVRDCDLFDDGAANGSCTTVLASCSDPNAPPQFSSTFEGIQTVIFEGYGCTNPICHDAEAPTGSLDLTAAHAYDNLVGVPSFQAGSLKRVEPGDHALSLLYLLLSANTLGTPLPPGAIGGMPQGGGALTPEHLEAVRLWIRGGAPRDLVVEGTAAALGSCLPEPDPLIIPVPDPPGAGVGVQLQQTPWPLPSQSEHEICMATYYDLTATSLVPASARFFCGVTPTNPSGECFRWHRQTLFQDSQSHHSIIHFYNGTAGITDPAWGSFTYKFRDANNPLEGTPCDPTAIDSATGYNPGCSGPVIESIACVGNFGPADYSFLTAPQFSGSQEPLSVVEFADGVYSILPMQGILVWNSHAFNLTGGDSTMSQFLNLEFAAPADQLYPAQGIFDVSSIFVADVPAFETREYCKTFTLPQGAVLYNLSSHTHRHGVLFRIWAPPNTPCSPGQPACVPRSDSPLYESRDYSDPINMDLRGPEEMITLDSANPSDRTLLYCSLYDNGAGPGSPDVKRQSTSPPSPVGGPCSDAEVRCIGGPKHNQLCGGNDAFCDTSPGAGDGDCDACPLRGGFRTEDEMFILIGGYYVP